MAIPWYVYECCSAEGHSTGCPLPLPMDGARQAPDILGIHLLFMQSLCSEWIRFCAVLLHRCAKPQLDWQSNIDFFFFLSFWAYVGSPCPINSDNSTLPPSIFSVSSGQCWLSPVVAMAHLPGSETPCSSDWTNISLQCSHGRRHRVSDFTGSGRVSQSVPCSPGHNLFRQLWALVHPLAWPNWWWLWDSLFPREELSISYIV